MTSPLARRRQPRTTFGQLIRAWPKIRLALRVAGFVAKVRLAFQAALFTLGVVAIARVVRRRRRRRADVPVSRYAPPPVPTSVPGPGQPVAADAPTETERKLQAEK